MASCRTRGEGRGAAAAPGHGIHNGLIRACVQLQAQAAEVIFVPEARSGDCICVQIPGPITPATFQVAEGHNQPCAEEQKHKN